MQLRERFPDRSYEASCGNTDGLWCPTVRLRAADVSFVGISLDAFATRLARLHGIPQRRIELMRKAIDTRVGHRRWRFINTISGATTTFAFAPEEDTTFALVLLARHMTGTSE